jgi:YidC/Oxa1 family membrane protein insertase
MTNPRNLLLIALLFLGYLMWLQWNRDYGPPPADTVATTTAGATGSAPAAASGADATVPNAAVPAATVPEATPGSTPPAAGANAAADIPTATAEGTTPPTPAVAPDAAPASPRVVVTTDVLRVGIDTVGGNLVVAELLDYPVDLDDKSTKVRLLADDADHFFAAQSGLVGVPGTPAPNHQTPFTAERTSYHLGDAERVEVPLTWTDPSGVSVRKVFVFTRGSYVVEQRQEISNQGATAWTGNAYRQLQRVPPVINASGIKGYANTERYSFVGAAWYSPEDKFQKLKFADYAEEPLNATFAGGWAAMLQHYFFAAWIPDAAETDTYTTASVVVDGATRYLVRAMSAPISVPPGQTQTTSARLYVGPKLQNLLADIAPGLGLTIDYGMFTIISQPLHWVLSQFHKLTGNWGFAIILLVLLIKAGFFKLSEAQFRSMARMRKLQPRIAALKERFGDDRQKMNQAMLELYKKEKVNPFGGCLPMLVQIPVFFALYWVLLESVELRQAPFIGWIQNLTAPDPYYVLPVLNAAAMLATQYLTPTAGMDPMQAKMMKIMPFAFSIMFSFFPAGLVLYWTVNTGLSLLQQWIITRRIEAGAKA